MDLNAMVTQSCPIFCDPLNCSTLGLPVHHQLPEFTQTHFLDIDPLSEIHGLQISVLVIQSKARQCAQLVLAGRGHCRDVC